MQRQQILFWLMVASIPLSVIFGVGGGGLALFATRIAYQDWRRASPDCKWFW